jgi:hypothetical protein
MEDALVLFARPAAIAELATTLDFAADFARASKAKSTLMGATGAYSSVGAKRGGWWRCPPRQKGCVASWQMRPAAVGAPARLDGA